MSAIIDVHKRGRQQGTGIADEWRERLQPASFRGAYFHVAVGGRASGRRTVLHQYPKRNLPYAEDMGREAVHWQITGYILLNDKRLHRAAGGILYADLIDNRNKLIEALERDGAGLLIHPSMSSGYNGAEGASNIGMMLCMCERYSCSESREKGGYYEFDMQFVEAGEVPNKEIVPDSAQVVQDNAAAAEAAVGGMSDKALKDNLEE